MSKQRFLFASLSVFLMVIFASALWGAESTFIIKVGTPVAEDHPQSKSITALGKEVEGLSKGRLKVQLFANSQLGSLFQQTQAVKTGSQDVVLNSPGAVAPFQPSKMIGLLELYYVFRDPVHMAAVFNSPVGQNLVSQFAKDSGMQILGVEYYGTRHLTNSVRPVNKPEDLKGLKIRVPEAPTSIQGMTSMGASTVAMAFGELYMALQQKVVDGQENPLPTIYTAKFQEVQKYLALTGHCVMPSLILMNQKKWDSLPPDLKKIMQDSLKKVIALNDEEIRQWEVKLIADLKAAGMTVTTPDQAAIRQVVIRSWDKYLQTTADPASGKKILDEIQTVK